MGEHFDLEAELTADPPKRGYRESILKHPRIAEWLDRLLEMREGGAHITNRYIASKLTKGARLERIIGPDETISESLIQWHYRGDSRGRKTI